MGLVFLSFLCWFSWLWASCGENNESEDELILFKGFSEKNQTVSEKYAYSCFFGDSVNRMVQVAKEIDSRLKIRKKILDDPG